MTSIDKRKQVISRKLTTNDSYGVPYPIPIYKEELKSTTDRKDQRILGLQAAISRLQRNQENNRRETEKACQEAKREVKKELSAKFLAVLPSSNSNLSVSARVLINDVKKVLKDCIEDS